MNRAEFWAKHPGLVWSNRQASDEVYIRAALLRPHFQTLLAIALEFGLERLQEEWRVLCHDSEENTARARANVERCLRHLQEGFANAAS